MATAIPKMKSDDAKTGDFKDGALRFLDGDPGERTTVNDRVPEFDDATHFDATSGGTPIDDEGWGGPDPAPLHLADNDTYLDGATKLAA